MSVSSAALYYSVIVSATLCYSVVICYYHHWEDGYVFDRIPCLLAAAVAAAAVAVAVVAAAVAVAAVAPVSTAAVTAAGAATATAVFDAAVAGGVAYVRRWCHSPVNPRHHKLPLGCCSCCFYCCLCCCCSNCFSWICCRCMYRKNILLFLFLQPSLKWCSYSINIWANI